MKLNVLAAGLLIVVAAGVTALPPGNNEEIAERIQPVGEVCRVGDDCGVAGAGPSSGPMSGQQVYDQYCFACHSTGVGGAPKFGDTAAWAEREAKGMDILMQSTLNGLNTMPPKGTCMGCSDEELGEAVDYMLDIQ